MSIQELKDKRQASISAARKVIDTAEAEKRNRNAEEIEQCKKAMNEADEYKKEYEKLEAEQRDKATLIAMENELRASAGRRVPAEDPNSGNDDKRAKPIEVEFRNSGKNEKMVFNPGSREYSRASQDHQARFSHWIRHAESYPIQWNHGMYDAMPSEYRTANSLANDVVADGGYLHAPIQFNAQLIKVINNLCFVRNRARVLPVTSSDTLGTPTFPTLYSDASWTTELAAIVPDATGQFGRRDLKPLPLKKAILVSQKLLKTAAISPEGIVADELGRIFAYAEEKGYLIGTGSGQPLGVFVASASGISTGRDVTLGTETGSAETITFDGLMRMKYAVKAQYRNMPGTSWLFNRLVVQDIALIKDSYGRYIWEPSGQAGTPDTLLGYPVDESEFAPSAFTPGAYVGVFGNWYTGYWIADLVTGFEMQRLNELYALTDQVGFVGRKYTDGQPVQEQAFSRGKLT